MATATIGKWGNASALRLPKPFCEQLGIGVGSEVSVSLKGKRLVIEPVDEEFTLKGRAKDWDGTRYRAHELDWGTPQGDELW